MYSSYPLSNESIPSYFEEVYVSSNEPEKSFSLKEEIKNFFSRTFSSFSEKMQRKENLSLFIVPSLRSRSIERLQKKESYQIYLESLRKNLPVLSDQEEESKKKDQEDFACQEAVSVLEDFIQLGSTKEIQIVTKKAA
jgi:hypothetical protein